MEWKDGDMSEKPKCNSFEEGVDYIEDDAGDRWWKTHILAAAETERNEAQSEVRRLRAELDASQNAVRFSVDQMAKMLEQWQATDTKRAELERERDEALEALAVLVECSHGVSKGGCNCHRKAHAVLKRLGKP